MTDLMLVALTLLTPGMFFENSVRRDPGPQDPIDAIVHVYFTSDSGARFSCTGFFLQNGTEEFMVATARHCFQYQVTQACDSGQIEFKTAVGGFSGRCSNVIVADPRDDFTILEADFGHDSGSASQKIGNLSLTHQSFKPGTKLKMIGYPSDPERKGQLTVTENCWIQSDKSPDFVESLTPEENQKRQNAYEEFKKRTAGSKDTSELRARLSVEHENHNCSVYGGNSGGPIIIDGTRTVVGIPSAYWPGFYFKNKSESHSTEIFQKVVDV